MKEGLWAEFLFCIVHLLNYLKVEVMKNRNLENQLWSNEMGCLCIIEFNFFILFNLFLFVNVKSWCMLIYSSRSFAVLHGTTFSTDTLSSSASTNLQLVLLSENDTLQDFKKTRQQQSYTLLDFLTHPKGSVM